MYAKVILSLKNKEVDKVFDYFVPQQYCPISIGVRVIVPFGRANKSTEGYVVDLAEQTTVQKTKSIIKVLDEGNPIFTKQSIMLAKWMKTKYFCTLSQCLQIMMPAGMKTKFQWQVFLAKETQKDVFISSVENKVLDFLKQKQGTATIEEIKEELGENVQDAIQLLKEKEMIRLKQNIQQKNYDKEIIVYALSDNSTVVKEVWEDVEKKGKMLAQKKIMEYLSDGKQVTANELKQKLLLTDSPIRTLLPIALAAVTFGAGAAIGVAASAVISGTMGVMTAQPGEDLVGSFLGGAITGAISTFAIAAGATIGALAFGGGALATVCGLGASFVGGFIAGMAGNAYSQKVSYGKVDWKVASVTGFFNGITSAVSSYVIMAAPLISTALKPSLYFKEALKFSLVGASVGVYLSSLIPNFNDKRNK